MRPRVKPKEMIEAHNLFYGPQSFQPEKHGKSLIFINKWRGLSDHLADTRKMTG
jgi:hypothetical protein